MAVLLIIDMRVGMTSPPRGARNHPQAEASIARPLGAWRRANAPVVHMRHAAEEAPPMALAHLHGDHATVIDTQAAAALLG